jgi:transposase
LQVFALKIVRALELLTMLNHGHRHRGFVYQHARFGPDKKSLEVDVRPREGSAAVCSGCHQPAAGYDHLPERCFAFIPLWGFLVFLQYRMRRVDCRNCGVVVEEVPWSDGKHPLTRAYMLFLARWARKLSWKETAQALHILDRFPIVAKMNKALDEVRAAESRQMAQDGHQPLLKKSRWCVLKRKENLTSQQKLRLPDLLRYNLRTVRADLRKEDFQQFWEYNSPTWAGMFLDFRCQQTMRSRSEPMKKIARTLRAHRALLLNYCKARKQFSSGVVEGLNNKAKVTMRRSYGFRTFHILELALYHSLGKLPEPELTHEFF